MSVCAVVWCDQAPAARGLCKRCYAWWRKCLPPTPPRKYASIRDKQRLRYEATQRREAGESVADIASSVGVTNSTLSRWFREWEVKPVPGRERVQPPKLWQPWTRQDIEFAVLRTDLTVAERAAVLGRTVTGIIECVRKHGPE